MGSEKYFLQQPYRNLRTRFGIGEGVVVMLQMIAAGRSNGVQLVVGEVLPKMVAGGVTGAVELVVGIVHLINIEYRPQAAFVKRAVVCHQRQTLDQRLDLLPHLREQG